MAMMRLLTFEDMRQTRVHCGVFIAHPKRMPDKDQYAAAADSGENP
jgi:hypothetical protein